MWPLTHDQVEQFLQTMFFFAFAAGMCGAIVLSAFVCVASRVIVLIGHFFDRRDRIRQARGRAAQEAAI